MSLRLLSLLTSLLISSNLYASLTDYIVYTSEGISAECSDFLGSVKSDGPIYLRHFLIQSNDASRCPLASSEGVTFMSGSVKLQESPSCIRARFLNKESLLYSRLIRNKIPSQLSTEMVTLLENLQQDIPGSRRVYLDLPTEPSQGVIKINGSSNELLVIIVPQTQPVIEGLGIELSGGIDESRIVWLFPNATTLRIARSGMNPARYGRNIGIPGTFIAPYAEVSFQNALITGALFARSLIGLASDPDCRADVSGQINPAPLKLPVPPRRGGKG